MGATLQDTLNEAADLARQQASAQPPPGRLPPQRLSGTPLAASPLPGSSSNPQSVGQPQRPSGTAPQPPPPAKSPGLVQSLLGSASKALTGLGAQIVNADANPISAHNLGQDAAAIAGVLRAPGQLVGGALDTAADAGHFIGDNMHSAFVRKATDFVTRTAARTIMGNPTMPIPQGASLADVLSGRSTMGQIGDVKTNQAIAGFTAAGLPLAIPGVGEAGFVARMAAVGAGAAATADPQSQDPGARLADRAVQGVAGAATEGVLSGVAHLAAARGAGTANQGEALVQGVKALGARLRPAAATISEATPAEAASDALDRTFATRRTEEARWKAADAELKGTVPEAQPQEALPQGTRHGDDVAPPTSQATTPHARASSAQTSPPSATAHPLAGLSEDANAALAKSGAAERLDPATLSVTPEGKVEVAPVTKAALDDAGMGRAFTSEGDHGGRAPSEHPPAGSTPEGQPPRSLASSEGLTPDPGHVLFKETDEAGGSRVIGGMDKYDLHAFLADAEHYAANPAEIDTPADAHVGQWKLGNLGASYDVGARVRALADRLEGSVRPKSDAETYDLAKRIAAEHGGSPEDALTQAAALTGRTSNLDADMLAHRMLLAASMRDLDAHVGTRFATLDPNHPDVLAALDAVHNSMMLTAAGEEAKTGMGRGLRAAGLPTEQLPSGLATASEVPPQRFPDRDAYVDAFTHADPDKLPPRDPRLGPASGLPRTPEELQQWLDLYGIARGSDDPDVLRAFLKGNVTSLDGWKFFRNSYANFFTAAIVSAPRTFVRDLWGPAIVSGLNTVGRSISAAGLAAINPMLEDAERRELWGLSWGAPRAYAMGLTDVGDALKFAAMTTKRAFTQGAPARADSYLDPFGSNLGSSHGVLGGHNPIDYNTQGVPRALIQAATNGDPMQSLPFWMGNMVSKFPQAIHALHGGVNELAQRLSYLGEVRASAYAEASRDGLSGSDFDAYVKQRVANATDETGAYTDQPAFDASERTAFIRRATTSDPIALQLAQKWRAEAIAHVPELRAVMPIFTVPANALGEALRRIPGLSLAFEQTRNELLGQAGVQAQADAYGRTLTGAAALAGGYFMARNGALTGAGPEQPQARAIWLATHQPYSIRVGEQWYSYAKSDILGPMLGIMAGVYDRTVHEDEDRPHGVYSAVAGLAEYFKDQASLQTLSELFNIGGNLGGSDRKVVKLLGGIGSGFVPNFVNQLGRESTDDLLRVKRSPWDYIQDRLPMASQALDPVRNALGEPVHKPHSPGLNSFPVNIANATTWASDPVMEELGKSYEASGYAPGLLPSAMPGAHFDLRDVKAEDGYSAYDHIMRHMATAQDGEGRTLRQALTDVITSDAYKAAPDGRPGTTGEADSTEGRVETRGGMLADVFRDFHKVAKEDAAKESPVVARYLAIGKAKAHDPAQLGSHRADELASPQGTAFMRSLGIDLGQYEAAARGEQ